MATIPEELKKLAFRELSQLRMVSASPIEARASVDIYRPFFLAGILSVLTAGCTLGAIALLGISIQGSYTTSAWTPYVLAHANSQLYGWVGFFIIGFALQQHAPRESRKKLFYALALWSLCLMAIGIGLRFAAEPLIVVEPSVWLPLGVFSCALQLVAVILFIVNTSVTRFKTPGPLTWQTRIVFTSLFWWLIVAVAEPIFFTMSHQPGLAGVQFIAQWFPPYRDAQFLGFVAMMIFGVALVKMNSCFGAKSALRDLAMLGFILWNVGLLARMAGWVLYFRAAMEPNSDRLYVTGGCILALAAVALVVSSRLFERTKAHIPSHKFVRAAMAWFLIAGLLLMLEPLHWHLAEVTFSHAYIGAVRHAITVGFISQMIMGVSMHVIAQMNHTPENMRRELWTVFWLLNIGNFFRVAFEIASGNAPGAFLPMGATGFVELMALFIWAGYVVPQMVQTRHRLAR